LRRPDSFRFIENGLHEVCRKDGVPQDQQIQNVNGSRLGRTPGREGGIYQIFEIPFETSKIFQSDAWSKPQFFSPVPERVVIDPEELRRPSLVPPGQPKRFRE
jgi:hypothetical protein